MVFCGGEGKAFLLMSLFGEQMVFEGRGWAGGV